MTATILESKGRLAIQITGENDTDAAGLANVANPEGVALVITKAVVLVNTPSTGAATLGIGCGASGASVTTLFSALTVNGAITGKAYNGLNPAANAELDVWGASEYLTVTGSADTSGLDATLYLDYVHA